MFSNNLSSIKDVSIYPIIALLLFFILFIIIIVKLFVMDKKVIKEMENIPLNDDTGKSKTNSENKNEE